VTVCHDDMTRKEKRKNFGRNDRSRGPVG